MKPANDYGSSTNQPAWVAIAVAVIMSVVGPLVVWNATNRNAELQKNDTSTLSQEVNRLVDRVNQIRSTVEAYSTSPSSTGTPQPGIELADLKKLTEQISTLEQQVAALNARPSPTPLPGPLVSAGDLEALRNRVVDLEKTIQAYGTPEPLTLPTVLAQEGIPVDSKLAIEGATASSTLYVLDQNEKPIYTPDKAIDSNNATVWPADTADLDKPWIELKLDRVYTITGIKFLVCDGCVPAFQDAMLIFSNDTAQKLHLTPAQLQKTGWSYFPLVQTQADRIRIVLLSPIRSLRTANFYGLGFAEIEVYGK